MTTPAPGNGRILEPTLIWRDGSLIPFADATVHVLSHTASRGSQVFDVLPVVSGAGGPAALGLREHVTRFVRSAEAMGMVGVDRIAALERAVAETVLANLEADDQPAIDPGVLVVKIIASWDDPALGVAPSRRTPTVYVAVTPLDAEPGEDRAMYGAAAPIAVKVADMPKIPASVLPPSIKVAAAYTPGLRHHMMAADDGFDQVLFRTVDGDLAESVTSSFFVVGDGRIAAPPVDTVLDGITRRAVLDVAEHEGVPWSSRPVAWREVSQADELFLTSSIKAVVPVARLDDRKLEAPGPVTARLTAGMRQLVAGSHPLSRRWMTPLAPLVQF